MNAVTPRVFVAATRQNDGKTTTSLGLFAALGKRLGDIGFIKPIGQRFIEVEGKSIDEDSFLIEDTFGSRTPLEAMSPIAVEPDFTRRYIEKGNIDFLTKRIQNSFDRSTWEKQFAIIEGTGHAGVGSVFDLSNARVARLLQSKVVLITKGGIGRPIDEVALNKALFDQEGVEIVGVIINKVLPKKFEYTAEFARRGLERLGIDLVGVIPDEPLLAYPTLRQICGEIRGEFINGEAYALRRVSRVIIGAMSSSRVMEHFSNGTLVITPGDREDVILAALSTESLHEDEGPQLAGIVLSGDILPHPSVMQLIKRSSIPFMVSANDSYSVASSIHSMTIKTLPGDTEKIERIQSLVEEHVEVDRLLEKIKS